MNTYKMLVIFVIVSGCASTRALRTDLSSMPAQTGRESEALVNNLLDAYRLSANSRLQLNGDLKQDSVNNFTDAGITLSDHLCENFFRATNASARRRQFARGTVNDVGGIISAVLGLASAGSAVTGGVAAGFSFLDSGFRNYDSSFLVDTDISKVRRLTVAAQDNMKQHVLANRPNTVFAAQSTIIRYSSLCSFLGMQDLINSAISEKATRIENTTNPQRVSDVDTGVGVAEAPPASGAAQSNAAIATPQVAPLPPPVVPATSTANPTVDVPRVAPAPPPVSPPTASSASSA